MFNKDKKESGDNNELQSIKNIGATNLNNTEGKPKKVDTIYRTLYNKYGNKENRSTGRIVGEGSDSIGKDGKKYYNKTKYEKG
ncbi:MAG TPA: hypothetical protein VFN30_13115 [Chitinophagaceae bacterium]|nr:hypothetical protein [Chitinophagaceae bacterium]